MAFELSKFEVMQYLWSTMDKTEDGEHIRYTSLDVEQLWWMGFVDTEKIGFEEWISVFEAYRHADGSFLLNKDEFLSLDVHRYKGEIRVPFDAMQINEGKYTDDGLDDLVDASIVPSSSLSPEQVRDFFKTLKDEFRGPDGLILIKRPAKEKINALVNSYPSPLHNLEVIFDNMIKARGKEMMQEIKESAANDATAQAALQASHFSSSPVNAVEAGAKNFKDVAKSKKRHVPAEIEGVEKVELKKIRRSRKGVRG